MARGTNFPVTPKEWVALQPFLGARQSEGEREAAVEQNKVPKFKPKGVRDARKRILPVNCPTSRTAEVPSRLSILVLSVSSPDVMPLQHWRRPISVHTKATGQTIHERHSPSFGPAHAFRPLFDFNSPIQNKVTLAPQLRETNYREFEEQETQVPREWPEQRSLGAALE